jgi:hypothetical protein
VGAREVVRRAGGDHAQRHAETPCERGHGADRAVAAGHHDPVGFQPGHPVELVDPEHLDLGPAHGRRERLRVQTAARVAVGGEDDAHER